MNREEEMKRLARHSAIQKELAQEMDISSVLMEGMGGFAKGLAVGTIGVGGLHQFHSGFRNFMNKPGKIYLVCMISSFGAAYYSQQDVVRQNKEHWRASVVAANKMR
jgi:hypothetical protein